MKIKKIKNMFRILETATSRSKSKAGRGKAEGQD